MAALLVALTLGGCAGAPVQEMSNARQAVAAAEQSGASHKAPKEMAEAKGLLQAAQTALDRGDFGTALEDALRARQLAVKALRISQGQESANLSPP